MLPIGISNLTTLKKFTFLEFSILALIVFIIFLSEYYFIVLKDHERAIFIGLWPPTMVGLLIYFNQKKNQ